jgi:hypothetical protein
LQQKRWIEEINKIFVPIQGNPKPVNLIFIETFSQEGNAVDGSNRKPEIFLTVAGNSKMRPFRSCMISPPPPHRTIRLNAISGWSDSSRKFLVLSGLMMEQPRSAG